MNKKVKILVAIGILATIGVGFGIYSYVNYQIKLYKTLVVEHNRINIMDEFLTRTFPDQVGAYVEARKQSSKENIPTASPLPTSPAIK